MWVNEQALLIRRRGIFLALSAAYWTGDAALEAPVHDRATHLTECNERDPSLVNTRPVIALTATSLLARTVSESAPVLSSSSRAVSGVLPASH